MGVRSELRPLHAASVATRRSGPAKPGSALDHKRKPSTLSSIHHDFTTFCHNDGYIRSYEYEAVTCGVKETKCEGQRPEEGFD